MQRDMDVVRKIVLGLRDAQGPIQDLDGVDEGSFNHNAQLIIEAGLAIGQVMDNLEDRRGIPALVDLERLTWDGHDFADSIADDTIWKKAKEKIIKPSASWTFGILREYIKAEIKKRLGLDLP